MPDITESQHIAGVYVVEPTIHGDERGLFIETYRREWIPGAREMLQSNRANRQQGALVGAALPPASERLLVHPVRHRPGRAARPARRGSDRRSDALSRPVAARITWACTSPRASPTALLRSRTW